MKMHGLEPIVRSTPPIEVMDIRRFDPKVKKTRDSVFLRSGWNSGSPGQFESQARYFAKRGMIAITQTTELRSRHGVQVVECVKDAKAAIAWVRENPRHWALIRIRSQRLVVLPVGT